MTYFEKMYKELLACQSVDAKNSSVNADRNIIDLALCDFDNICINTKYIDNFSNIDIPYDVINVLEEYYYLSSCKGRAMAKFNLSKSVSDSKENSRMNDNQRLYKDEKLLHKVRSDIHRIRNQQKHCYIVLIAVCPPDLLEDLEGDGNPRYIVYNYSSDHYTMSFYYNSREVADDKHTHLTYKQAERVRYEFNHGFLNNTQIMSLDYFERNYK